MNLLQVTCEAPPDRGGIAHYLGGFLSNEASAGLRTGTVFVIRDSYREEVALPTSTPTVGVCAAKMVEPIRRRIENLGDGVLLFHYSGYGYDPTGAPLRLIDNLLAVERATGWALVTLFHEVHATGYPWQRAFWYTPSQMYAARKLARHSDLNLSTTGRGRRRILQLSNVPDSRVHQVAIPATIGEAAEVSPWPERDDACVVFGRRERKESLLVDYWKEIQLMLSRLGVREIRDLGEPVGQTRLRGKTGPIPLRRMTGETNVEIAREFGRSKYFLIDTPADLLDKSTVFANGVAHGCIPLWVKSQRSTWPGPGQFVIDLERMSDPNLAEELPRLSCECRDYYQSRRSWESHMANLAQCLAGMTKPGVLGNTFV